MASKEVKLLGMWASPLALRIEWAMKFKGIGYEYIEEDLLNKSERLLKYNPIHKKVPVLLHGDKPIVESLVILEYIDETWPQNPLLPEDPYERALMRFWAKFNDEKCWTAIFGVISKTGEEQEAYIKEFTEGLKKLDNFLNKKRFFGGETIGYLDIVLGYIAFSIPFYEEILSVDLVNEISLPSLSAWTKEFLNVPCVKEALPPHDKLHAHLTGFRQMLLAQTINIKV